MWKGIFSCRDLKKHINSVHKGKKDHKCDSCEKVFSEAGTLNRHINKMHEYKVHEDNKECYKCEYCEKLFRQSHTLKTHIRSVH